MKKILVAIIIIILAVGIYFKVGLFGENNVKDALMKIKANNHSILLKEEKIESSLPLIDLIDVDLKEKINNYENLNYEIESVSSTIKKVKILNLVNKTSYTVIFKKENNSFKPFLNIVKNNDHILIKNEIRELLNDIDNNLEKLDAKFQLYDESFNDDFFKNEKAIVNTKISLLKEIQEAKNLIKIQDLKKKNNLIEGIIQNNSNKSIKKIIGVLRVLNKNGDVLINESVELFSLDNRTIFSSEELKPNFYKKFFIKPTKNIDKEKTLIDITVSELSF